jgi:hypothetical protein
LGGIPASRCRERRTCSEGYWKVSARDLRVEDDTHPTRKGLPIVRKALLVTVGFVVVFLPQMGQAWNGQTHMAIAAAAYRGLPVAARQRADAILRKHPDYHDWVAAAGSDAGADLGLYVAMRASRWPDDIRSSRTYHHAEMARTYNKPEWHFVDYPLIPTAPPPKPLTCPMKPRPTPSDDVVYGLQHALEGLVDPAKWQADASEKWATRPPDELRAVCLCWVLHLTGDVHQPLHCASYFGKPFENTPGNQGDRGGNWFYVKDTGKPYALHGFWDERVTTSNTTKGILRVADKLAAQKPGAVGGRPESWSLESRAAAIQCVYSLKGQALSGTQPKSFTSPPNPPDDANRVPAGYRAAAKDEALKRCVAAAGRLRKLLAAALK